MKLLLGILHLLELVTSIVILLHDHLHRLLLLVYLFWLSFAGRHDELLMFLACGQVLDRLRAVDLTNVLGGVEGAPGIPMPLVIIRNLLLDFSNW